MVSPWLAGVLALGIAVLALLVLFVAAIIVPQTARAVREQFYCPWRRRNVMVRFLTGERGERVRVLSCTAFADPLIVTCDQQCVTAPPDAGSYRREVTAA